MTKLLSGEVIIFTEAIIWAFFPILSKLILEDLPSILVVAYGWLFAGMLFAIMLTLKKKWKCWSQSFYKKEVLWAGFISGVVFHGLIFQGLQYTSAGNMAIIGLTEILFSYLFFSIWKKEKEPFSHKMGALFVGTGALIIFVPDLIDFQFNKGDILILLAFSLVPLGNYFQQKAVKSNITSNMILFSRSILSVFFLFPLSYLLESWPSHNLVIDNLLYLMILGFLVLGFSKILWVEGLKRMSVPKAASLSSIGPIFTLFFAFIILNEVPSLYQILALIPMLAGLYLLVRKEKT